MTTTYEPTENDAQAVYTVAERATGRRTPKQAAIESRAVGLGYSPELEIERAALAKSEATTADAFTYACSLIGGRADGSVSEAEQGDAARAWIVAGDKLAVVAAKVADKFENDRADLIEAAQDRSREAKLEAAAKLTAAREHMLAAAREDALLAALRDNRKGSAYRPIQRQPLKPAGGDMIDRLIDSMDPPPPPYRVAPAIAKKIATGDVTDLVDLNGESIDADELARRGYRVAHGSPLPRPMA